MPKNLTYLQISHSKGQQVDKFTFIVCTRITTLHRTSFRI